MATRYWVGGNGTWDASSTANWSTASGGASGASAPVAADTVIFDSLSGTGTCTTASGAVCATATLNSSTLGLTLGANLTMSGAFGLTLGALDLANNTLTGSIFVSSNSNVRSIAFGSSGKIIVTGSNATVVNFSPVTNFSYTGTSYIESNYSGSTGTRVIATGGATQAQAQSYYITGGTDTVTVGTANHINLTGFAGSLNNSARSVFGDLIIPSGVTCVAGTNATTFAGAAITQKITTNGVTLDFPLTFNAVGGTFQFQDALTQGSTRNFTVTNGTVQLKAGATTAVGTFATSGTGAKTLSSSSAGSQATLSQASGTVNAQNINIQDIMATGGATWNAVNGALNKGNNTGWYFSHQMGNLSPTLGW